MTVHVVPSPSPAELPVPPPEPAPEPITSAPAPAPPAAEPPPFDVDTWLDEHHLARADFLYSECSHHELGRPPLDGVVCLGGPPMEASLPSGHSVFPVAALVVDGGKLRVVLRTAVMAGPLVSEGEGDGMYVRLHVDVGADGMRIDVRDAPGRTCADALARAAQLGDAANARMVRLACTSRGAYVWAARGRFERR